ncbi:ABC transporter substrate-binding protein [Streptomyces poriferorum]|uniref:ABC transporter substrate-binding protein n=1 Tax=Streptomyces poriferorum TaxID=2798799 RepID=A0ABY9IZP0_9ACTN|nr:MULTISPECIES: ABC transporter substrate-binding protein [unclassified Streptomyces]MDP5310017.1 ABC transporter substrate-binding protein [Streptomyces sp. Alt4]WLQ46599.1 ABC transporter substrate-binding protein [Streptomyces sp. Alt1]WLQ60812.1 ABC transporter substrate-binding protein [Streptomyces sp. Alt2]WSI61302.1 ABC transporter substrate-binding protein [Streptomyces sp. NBC_01336]
MMIQRRTRTLAVACLLAATATLAASGCSKSETSDTATTDSSQGAQAAKTPESSSGSGCSLQTYGAPKLDLKNAVVGFSQSEKEANPFRIAETQSIKDEAKKVGVKKLLTTNAQSQLSKQISDIQDMLSQGAQFLIVAPLNSDGLEPALKAAAAKKVPVLTIDRKVNATACKDYVAFLGSDFVEQGKRAADAMIKTTGGKGKVAILLGASGNNVTTDRTKGFVDQLKAEAPGLEIVAQQTGEFARDKGQQVMEQLIQSKPDITAVYAENDEMGLGAVTALKAAGKKPGKDVKIVSVDGTRNAVQALVNGEYNAVIESNPRFGPLAFATAQKFYAGESIPENVIITDRAYDESNAKASLGGAF